MTNIYVAFFQRTKFTGGVTLFPWLTVVPVKTVSTKSNQRRSKNGSGTNRILRVCLTQLSRDSKCCRSMSVLYTVSIEVGLMRMLCIGRKYTFLSEVSPHGREKRSIK